MSQATSPPHQPGLIDDDLARRNATILMAAAAVSGYTMISSITLAGLAGLALAPVEYLATAPITALTIGIAVGVIPAGVVMGRHGRKSGFLAGCALGAIGGCIATAALYLESFWIFCLGLSLVGMFNGFNQQFRFAAADVASEAYKPKAISRVLVGGILAAIIAPQIVIWSRDLLHPVAFAGAFALHVAAALITAVFVSRLRIPHNAPAPRAETGRPLGVLLRQPRLIAAIMCGVTGYGLMNFIMTAAPLAMDHHGHGVDASARVIQMHVLAMFGPSIVTGHLIARFGKETIITIGLVLLIASGLASFLGTGFVVFSAVLILLGVGWNFAFIGATALVTDCHRRNERAKVQMFNDVLVFGSLTIASLSSGAALYAYGWAVINGAMVMAVLLILLVAVWMKSAQTDPAGGNGKG